MGRTVGFLAIAGLMSLSARSLAVEIVKPAVVSKQQRSVHVNVCMKRRMSASRAITYNDAMKICQSQVAQAKAAARGALVAAESGVRAGPLR